LLLQKNANQAAAPPGVLLAHFDRFLELVTRGVHLVGCTASVIGLKPVLSTFRKAAHQVTHGARRKFEFFGKAGDRFAILPPSQD
jgi:hypothetical protein